jgi:LacI family transcriptional regulator
MTYSDRLRHPASARFDGYRKALDDAGIELEPAFCRRYEPASESAAIAATIREWVRPGQMPTAIIAAEDIAAIEVIEQLAQRGVRVPEDICVAGFDDQEAARSFRPRFPTTRPDFVRMGELAAAQLIQAIRSAARPEGIQVLDVPFLERMAEGVRNRATGASAYYAY